MTFGLELRSRAISSLLKPQPKGTTKLPVPPKFSRKIQGLKGKEIAWDKMGSFRSHRRNAAENENHLKALGVMKWNSHSYSTQELLSVYMRLLFYFMYMIILYREVWKEL